MATLHRTSSRASPAKSALTSGSLPQARARPLDPRAHRAARGDERQVVGYYVVSTDIHEIKVAPAAVEDKERQLRQVIDSIPTPMCIATPTLRYRYVNDAFLDYVGLPPSASSAHGARDLRRGALGAFEPIFERVRRARRSRVERLIRFADGRERWMTCASPRADDRAATPASTRPRATSTSRRWSRRAAPRQLDPLGALRQHAARGDRVRHAAAHRALVRAGRSRSSAGAPRSARAHAAGWRLVYEEDEPRCAR
jgi:PAS domain-containing protein